MPINYHVGDATEPIGDGPKAIIHINNNLGAWGGGFVLAISEKWPRAEKAYRALKEYELGFIQVVPVDENLVVVNMVAQNGFPSDEQPVAVDYSALEDCLWLANRTLPKDVSIHAPRIGTGIAGGDWNEIEVILANEMPDRDINIYDLPGSKFLIGLE